MALRGHGDLRRSDEPREPGVRTPVDRRTQPGHGCRPDRSAVFGPWVVVRWQNCAVTQRELSDAEWVLIEPLLPIGRSGPYPQRLREQVEAVSWRFRTGGQ